MSNYEMAIKVIEVLSSVLIFALLCLIGFTYQRGTVVKIYERINSQLREQKRLFDYDKTERFLRANGAKYHIGRSVEPVRYYAIRLIFMLLGIFLGIRFHAAVALVLAVILYHLPKLYIQYANRQDNEKMLSDMKLIFHALFVQIRSGVYITDAVAECYESVSNKRLKTGLQELTAKIVMKNDFEDAMNDFQSKFDNKYVDAMNIILIQAMESGQSVELLADISDQINDMAASMQLKKKAALDRHTTFYLLGIMVSLMAIVLYACVSQMFALATNF